MDPITVIVFVFLAVTLPIAAVRARNTLKAHDAAQAAKRPANPATYSGPIYSRSGREIR